MVFLTPSYDSFNVKNGTCVTNDLTLYCYAMHVFYNNHLKIMVTRGKKIQIPYKDVAKSAKLADLATVFFVLDKF